MKLVANVKLLPDAAQARSLRATLERCNEACNWGFHQLRGFLTYKARLAGVPLVLVDPRHTSQTCPACGFVARQNRKTRDDFVCGSCGFAGAADHIAALNIRAAGLKARAAVNQPMVASVLEHNPPQLQAPHFSAG